MDVWKTKDGREMPVTEMSDSHLLRTIRLVESRLVDLGLSDTPTDRLSAKWRQNSIREATVSLDMLKREADRRNLSGWAKFGITLVQKVLE